MATKIDTLGAPEQVESIVEQIDRDQSTVLRRELAEEGHDLPELSATMEEANARATASTYLFALRNVKRDLDANDAEFTVLQHFNRSRHVARQTGLLNHVRYLRDSIRTLFGFMTVTGKKKSLNLVGGRVGTKGKPDELVVLNPDEVIVWAEANDVDDIVKLKKTVDLRALRAHMVKREDDPNIWDHEPPPGVTLESRPDEFFATPATD